jgi:restriction system protein
MQGTNTGSEPATSLHDSVVSGDVHTGNIIHNHYHITQTTPAPQNPVPQVVQPAAQIQQRPLIHVDLSGNNALLNGERNIVTAYLLCIFFGYFGAHRFYLGHTKIGIAYIFTFAFFGIGWLQDLITLPDLVRNRNRLYIPSGGLKP